MKKFGPVYSMLFNGIRRSWRTFFGMLVVGAAIQGLPANAQEPMNVLFIAIDDMKAIGSLHSEENGDFLRHIYPDENLRTNVAARMTPNLQKLADEGVAFMSAYCASAACNPSRAALLTGIAPHTSGLASNEDGVFFRDWEDYPGHAPLADAVTLPELLKNNGWYTAETGKIFHGKHDFAAADGNRSWTDWTDINDGAGAVLTSPWSPPDGIPWGREGDPDASVALQIDNRSADFIGRLLQNGVATNGTDVFEIPQDSPFFVALGIQKPHLPFNTTQSMLNLFPTNEMTVTRELLDYFIEDARDLPPDGLRVSGCDLNEDGDPVMTSDRFIDILKHGLTIDAADGDLKGWKDMLMHYFACVATADRAVGRVLEGLENGPYATNTMVILWSDHGYHLGEKIHVSKFTLWEAGSRVDFIIKDPRNPQAAGQRCDRPVSLLDIYPTVAEQAGLALPDNRINGRNLTPLLQDPSYEDWGVAYSTFGSKNSHLLRDGRYKMIRRLGRDSEIELYDLQTDGEEYYNLVNDTNYVETLTSLKASLEREIPVPSFNGTSLSRSSALVDAPYRAYLSTDATDLDHDPLTFSKLEGPGWVHVETNGLVWGTPSSADLGLNTITVMVDDGEDGTDAASLQISVVFDALLSRFSADFSDSQVNPNPFDNGSPVSDPYGGIDNLNAGTQVGTWSAANLKGSSIYQNDSNNNVLFAGSGDYSLSANLSSPAIISNSINVSLSFVICRTGTDITRRNFVTGVDQAGAPVFKVWLSGSSLDDGAKTLYVESADGSAHLLASGIARKSYPGFSDSGMDRLDLTLDGFGLTLSLNGSELTNGVPLLSSTDNLARLVFEGDTTFYDNIQVSTVSPGEGISFGTWAGLHALSEVPDGDDDKDGVSNFGEFALGGDPTNSANSGHAPVWGIDPSALKLIHVKRPGLIYSLQSRSNLVSGSWADVDLRALGSGPFTNEFSVVTNQFDLTEQLESFFRLHFESAGL